ncbi:MAG TPA: 4-hydroxy-tetrahydrodipicolinate reductase [Candidatus Acidoferrales bacterium]|nr:4-hydroxy-tetrahydrodipicolinate reductase [Candidatus Acidoferrales bacterium]
MAVAMIVCGAAGRMGRALTSTIQQTAGARLLAAIESPQHPDVGRDVGEVAAVGRLGVPISTDLGTVAGPETVILDFTNAAAAVANLRVAVERRSAMVLGSTGFTPEQQIEVDRLAPQIRSVVSSNMSVGIAVLHRLVREAAIALGEGFDPEIVEMHHRMKVDAPSGTALALAKTLTGATKRDLTRDGVYGREGIVGQRTGREIGILALRGGDVIGDHTVIFAGLGERIELTHRAQSRDSLARGAVRAALWVADQPVGRYGIHDVLGL